MFYIISLITITILACLTLAAAGYLLMLLGALIISPFAGLDALVSHWRKPKLTLLTPEEQAQIDRDYERAMRSAGAQYLSNSNI